MSTRIKFSGIGVNHTVELETDESVAQAAAAVGLDPQLGFRVNGVDVPGDYIPNDGETIIATPPNVKLG